MLPMTPAKKARGARNTAIKKKLVLFSPEKSQLLRA